MYEWRPYLAYLYRRGRWGQIARDLVAHIAAHRRIPLLPTLPRKMRETVDPLPAMVFPVWLNAELIKRLQLRERWEQFQRGAPIGHPVRPESDRSFRDVIWSNLLESLDDAAAHLSFEFRYPYLDLRLLRFFLAVPAMPWCRRKHLLRRALRGRLPEEVLDRPKTPVKGSLPAERGRGIAMPSWQPPSVLSRYLNWGLVSTANTRNWAEYDANMRAIGLHYWLRGV
jgi:asparagine synthase (glutamine-hydrolysing)